MGWKASAIGVAVIASGLAGCLDDPDPESEEGRWVVVDTDTEVKSVTASPDGEVFITAEPSGWESWSIYRLNSAANAWDTLIGNAFWLSAGPNWELWAICRGNELWYRGSRTAAWIQNGYALDAAIGAGGEAYRIDLVSGDIRGLGGTPEVVQPPEKAAKLAVAPNGDLWILDRGKRILRWNGDAWSVVPGTAEEITVSGDGSVFTRQILDDSTASINRWDGKAWKKAYPGTASRIAGGPGRTLWGLIEDSELGGPSLVRSEP